MKYVVVWLKSLKDLLLRNPDYIFKYKNKYFASTIASDFAVFWITKDDAMRNGFIKLDKNLNITVSKLPKFEHIPILEVESISEYSDIEFMKGISK